MMNPSPTLGSKLFAVLRGLAVLAVGLAMGCQSTVQVRHQDASDAQATSYASYEVMRQPVSGTEAVDEMIEHAIHQGMLAKGYERAPRTKADLVVSYKVLLGEDLSAVGAPQTPPDDGLNGDAKYSSAQPVWDFVAYDELPGPQLGEKRGPWPSPGPSPVFDTIPNIDVSGLSRQSQSKTLMVMLQEPSTLRVVWLGWSTADVSPGALASTTREAIGEIVSRLPGAGAPTAVD